jgi:hypothetical protein
MPPEVMNAMREASTAFVDFNELHERAGVRPARVTRNEAAYVTSGCSSAIVLTVWGCRTSGQLTNVAQLTVEDSLLKLAEALISLRTPRSVWSMKPSVVAVAAAE